MFGNLDPSGGVANRKGDIATLAFGDDRHHSWDFGGGGDDADCRRDREGTGFEFVGAVTRFEIIETIGDGAEYRGGVDSTLSGRQEGTFDMGAEDL